MLSEKKTSCIDHQQLDVLFLHIPKYNNYYPALNVHSSCNRMALGLLALADFMYENGYRSRIIHTGIEHRLDKNFSFAETLRKYRPGVIGFSQHFHHNLVDTLQWAAQAKQILPESFIVLGGFTSTFFAQNIMQQAPFVDAICKGDAELPLLKLCKRIFEEQSHDLKGVPNFIWRQGKIIKDNEQSYTITQEIFNRLNFTNFSLLEHAEEYIGLPKAPIRTNLPGKFDKVLNTLIGRDKEKLYWGLPVGRGCIFNCAYCGGGSRAQQAINARKGIIVRKQEDVVKTICSLVEFGFRGAYVSFDPGSEWSEKYYKELFRKLRITRHPFKLLFSSWRLPTENFFTEFSKTFDQKSAVLISPETGSNRIRAQSRPNSFTNEELMARLRYADELGVRTVVYFSIGAFERTNQDLEQTLLLKKQIEEQINNVSIEGFLVETEPGAPWQLNPIKYEINLLRRNFSDFIRDHSVQKYSSMSHLGYTTCLFGTPSIEPEEFRDRLLQIRCKHFCKKKVRCKVMQQVWRMGRAVRMVPCPEAQSIEDILSPSSNPKV
ncbi:hypothetical protein KKHLCK_13470 [Candidatus Electrothrix laxa]